MIMTDGPGQLFTVVLLYYFRQMMKPSAVSKLVTIWCWTMATTLHTSMSKPKRWVRYMFISPINTLIIKYYIIICLCHHPSLLQWELSSFGTAEDNSNISYIVAKKCSSVFISHQLAPKQMFRIVITHHIILSFTCKLIHSLLCSCRTRLAM